MSIALERNCLHVLFNIPVAVELSVTILVAPCECPISSNVKRSGTASFAVMKMPAISASAADDTTFLIILVLIHC